VQGAVSSHNDAGFGSPADPKYHQWNLSSTFQQSCLARKVYEMFPDRDGLRPPKNG
jgi:hypothetical protein